MRSTAASPVGSDLISTDWLMASSLSDRQLVMESAALYQFLRSL
jgi:hypothetical protein